LKGFIKALKGLIKALKGSVKAVTVKAFRKLLKGL
jgi:hypothetical protein